mgnify:CR=1 FL=1
MPSLTANPFSWPTFMSRLAKPGAPADVATGGPFLAEMAAEAQEQLQHQQKRVPGAKAEQVEAGSGGQKGRASVQKQRRAQAVDVEQGVMEAVAGV